MASAPPQLHFDDGSRIIIENQSSTQSNSNPSSSEGGGPAANNPRGDTPLEIYYEIDRISTQIAQDFVKRSDTESESTPKSNDDFLIKVALQFPDELLADSAEVAWILDETISTKYDQIRKEDDEQTCSQVPLVFVLGDTTYASCCPDEIGAQHLNADVIVHFGQYACLSVSDSLPIIYSFGVSEWPQMEQCADTIVQSYEASKNESDGDGNGNGSNRTKTILVCERRYQHFQEQLAELLESKGLGKPIIGTIPASDGNAAVRGARQIRVGGCCGENTSKDSDAGCCNSDATATGQDSGCCESDTKANSSNCVGSECYESIQESPFSNEDMEKKNSSTVMKSDRSVCLIGGLQIALTASSLSEYTLIFIGDDSGEAKSRQFLNTVLKCTSTTKACWSYNPSTKQLSTDPMSILGVSRFLNRRFYLTMKAQLANIIGILVGTLSQDRFRSVVASVRKKIEDSGRSSYTFVVGKVNVAKLANFAEIECFVLIACGETSILNDERDYHLPVITPTELEIALGEKEWGGATSCNTDFGDFLQDFEMEQNDTQNTSTERIATTGKDDGDVSEVEESSDDDEPVYSMISGTYISKPTSLKAQRKAQISNNSSNLESLPGQGKMTEYKSEAAEFWKNREYKGLEAQIGKDEAKAATEGQTGIASDYGK